MGGICGGGKSSAVDEATGLTATDQHLIKESWYRLSKKGTLKENGTLFFLQLFKKFPYLKDYFHDFAGMTQQEMKNSVVMHAHATSVFMVITTYVDSMHDPHLLVALIDKRAKTHYPRGITYQDMQNLKIVMLEFLAEKTEGISRQEETLEAWKKFLTVHNNVYKAKCEELSAAESSTNS